MPGKKNHRGWGWIRKRSSGRFQASFVTGTGENQVRHYAPETFSTKMRAEAWLTSERDRIERSKYSAEKWLSPAERQAIETVTSETLADYGKRWIKQRNIKQRTVMHYESLLENHITPQLGKLTFDQLTTQVVRNWHAKTLVDKPTMRAHAYGLLSSICKTAVADGLIDRSPCQIAGAMHTKTKREMTILEISEVAALADEIDAKYKALVLISAWCGLRFGEVTELRRKDIGTDAETISIPRGVTHRSGQCMIDAPKSGKRRTVVVPPHIRKDIKTHLAQHVSDSPEALLFPPARGGCHLRDKVFRESYFNPALKSIGKSEITIHSLRHFAGSQVARVGNLVETMNHLGHSTVQASLIYQQIVSGRDAEIADALSALATK